jgi:hypothetical protein
MESRNRAKTVSTVALIGGIAILAGTSVVYCKVKLRQEAWQRLTSTLVREINSRGGNLRPGEATAIRLPVPDADEVILVDYLCDEARLKQRFSDRPRALLKKIRRIASYEHSCPALIWLRNDDILAITQARFTIGMDYSLESWRFDQNLEIAIRKERSSRNTFLSVFFPSESKQ